MAPASVALWGGVEEEPIELFIFRYLLLGNSMRRPLRWRPALCGQQRRVPSINRPINKKKTDQSIIKQRSATIVFYLSVRPLLSFTGFLLRFTKFY